MARTIDLDRFLDDRPITAVHIRALLMCALALLIDGFDIYLVGNLGPAMAAYFDVPPASLSLVFLLQQIGLATGAFLISPVSDRVGRKKVLLACAVAVGLFTLAALLSRTLLELAIFRALAGVFLGGVIPNALALLVEITPRRRQGLFVSIAFTGFAAGSIGGSLVAAFLVRDYGWQSGFWIGGVVPLLYAAAAVGLVPESVRFLHRRNPAHPAVRAMAERLEPTLRGQDIVFPPSERSAGPRPQPLDIFRDGRLTGTCLLWTILFFTIGTFGLMLAWFPTLFHERGGVSLQAYSSVAAAAMSVGLLGTLTIGYVLDRFRPTRVLIVIFCCIVAALLALAQSPFGTLLFTMSLVALMFFQASGQTGVNAITAQFYPVEVRATGVGWAFGAGRIGGIVGPQLGGLLLAANATIPQFLGALAGSVIVIVLLLIWLDKLRKAEGTPSVPAMPAPSR